MKKLGITYKYSYVEQWQPKDISTTFRMFQLNFDGNEEQTYMEYWNITKNILPNIMSKGLFSL